MKIGTVLVALVIGIASVSVTIWLFQGSRLPDLENVGSTAKPGDPPKPPPAPERPAISATGPHPKVQVDEPVFDFQEMESDTKNSHTFIVKNVGEAPLKLVKGTTTCKCTMSELAQQDIPPGQSGEITLSWEAKASPDEFRQTATIFTNDPTRKDLELVVRGHVRERILIFPVGIWPMPDVNEDGPTKVTGNVLSPLLESFKITGFRSADSKLTAEAKPLSKEQLATFQTMFQAKSGYEIEVTLQPGMPVGAFSLPLTIKTDLPKRMPPKDAHAGHHHAGHDHAAPRDASAGKDAAASKKTAGKTEDAPADEFVEFNVTITGRRWGPMQFFGSNWSEEKLAMGMGTFSSAEGKQSTLTMLVARCPAEGLTMDVVKTEPAGLKLGLKLDEKFQGKSKRYHVTFEVPPGLPPATHAAENPAKIHVKTNHPSAGEMTFQLYYNAY